MQASEACRVETRKSRAEVHQGKKRTQLTPKSKTEHRGVVDVPADWFKSAGDGDGHQNTLNKKTRSARSRFSFAIM